MKKILQFVFVTLLTSAPAWSQTITMSSTAPVYTTPSYGIGANVTDSYYDQDDSIIGNLFAGYNYNFQPMQDNVIEMVGTGGTTTFTDLDQYNNIPASYMVGATYSVATTAHLITGLSSTTFGTVTGITCTYCGYGYPASTTVPVTFPPPTGGGSPATGYFNTNANGVLQSPGTITSAGSSYSFVPEPTTPMVVGARTGTISAQSAASGSGITWTVSDSATSYNSFQPGDYVTISLNQVPSPTSFCTTNVAGINLSGSNTCSFETSDLPTSISSTSVQALHIVTGSSGSATFTFANDAGRRRFNNLTGTYSACITYHITAGSTSNATYSVVRQADAGNVSLGSGNISLSSTGGWQTTCGSFSPSETVSSPNGSLSMTMTIPANLTINLAYMGIKKSGGLTGANSPANSATSTAFPGIQDGFLTNIETIYGGPSQTGGAIGFRMWNGSSLAVSRIRNLIGDDYTTTPVAVAIGNPPGYSEVVAGYITQLVAAQQEQTLTGKALQPELVLPNTTNASDAALFIEWLMGSTSTTGGAIRNAEGYATPWTGSGGIFAHIKVTMGDENWNGSFYRFIYGYNGYIFPSSIPGGGDGYSAVGIGLYANYVYGKIQADAAYASGYLNFSLTTQTGSSSSQGYYAEAACTLCTEYEDAPYWANGMSNGSTYSATNASAGLQTEPYEYAYVSGGLMYGDLPLGGNGYGPINATATNPKLCSIYEEGPQSETNNSWVITQAQENQFTSGFQSGLGDLLIFADAEQQGCYGSKTNFTYGQYHITGPNNGGSQNYGFGTGVVGSSIWGQVVDPIEQKNRIRSLGFQLYNEAVIGPRLPMTLASQSTYNFSNSNTWLATSSISNIPYLTVLRWCQSTSTSSCTGTGRSVLVINVDPTSSHTEAISGADAPVGTVAVQTLTGASTDVNDDFPIKSCSTTSGTVSCVFSTLGGDAEALPFVAGDAITIANANTSAGTCNGNFTSIAVPSYGTVTFSGNCTSTGGMAGETGSNNNNTTIATSSVSGVASGHTFTFPFGATLLQYNISGSSTAATPGISPAAGTYTTPQTITLSDSTSGASVYYTTNGSTPTSASTLYSTPFVLSSGTTQVQAIAELAGDTNSAVASSTFTITPVTANPSFSPAGTSYSTGQSVTLSDGTSGASITYCSATYGSSCTPTLSYSTALSAASSISFCAFANASGDSQSSTVCANYLIGAASSPGIHGPGQIHGPGAIH